MPVVDQLGRSLRSVRISVTDRCNLRCEYCMPEPEYTWLERESLLHFEEISRLADVFLSLGIDKIRLTGGEPLLRRNLAELVTLLAHKPGLADLSLTTNAILLDAHAGSLKDAGLKRLNISLDTLSPTRFLALTRQNEHARVIAGIETAARLFAGVKLDAVIMRGVNDDELVALLEYGARIHAEVRFIEYMDVGGATRWDASMVVPRAEMLAMLSASFGRIETVTDIESTAPADRFRLPDGRTFGIISSTTEPFCRACDRSRLTADGVFYMCLYATEGVNLRDRLRAGVAPAVLHEEIRNRWGARSDHGAEDRLALRNRSVYLPVASLKADPHLEMHKRGG